MISKKVVQLSKLARGFSGGHGPKHYDKIPKVADQM